MHSKHYQFSVKTFSLSSIADFANDITFHCIVMDLSFCTLDRA
jgi:hypothetical protein